MELSIECSVAGLEDFLRDLADVTRENGEDVGWGAVRVDGMEQWMRGWLAIAVSFRDGEVSYGIMTEYLRERANPVDEPALRREVAEDLYRLLTDEAKLPPGCRLPARIEAGE